MLNYYYYTDLLLSLNRILKNKQMEILEQLTFPTILEIFTMEPCSTFSAIIIFAAA